MTAGFFVGDPERVRSLQSGFLQQESGETLVHSLPQQKKNTLLHSGSADCLGLLMVESGQLRAYILSDEGREITIYRLLERDICLLSASCMMKGARFDVCEAEYSFLLSGRRLRL